MIKLTKYGEVIRIDLARTIFGRGRYWTTAYRVEDLLIDTGPAHCAQELVDALSDVQLSRIVNTHTHEDHIGANGILQRRRGDLRIRVHSHGIPVLADPRREQPLHLYRRIFWGWPEPSFGLPLNDGDCIRTEHYQLHAIHTPGHSPDHVCLYEPEQGWLFTGDLYVGGKDRALREGYDIWRIIASLKQVAELPVRTLYPGSARARENPAQALREKIDYLENLGEKVLRLHQQGKSVSQIARQLLGGPMLVELVTLGHFSRRNLVRSYLGHFSKA